jgi:hypothetical protein
MCIPAKAPGFAQRLYGWHWTEALAVTVTSGTVTLLTPESSKPEDLEAAMVPIFTQ